MARWAVAAWLLASATLARTTTSVSLKGGTSTLSRKYENTWTFPEVIEQRLQSKDDMLRFFGRDDVYNEEGVFTWKDTNKVLEFINGWTYIKGATHGLIKSTDSMLAGQGWKMHYQPPNRPNFAEIVADLVAAFVKANVWFKFLIPTDWTESFGLPPPPRIGDGKSSDEWFNYMDYGKLFTFYLQEETDTIKEIIQTFVGDVEDGEAGVPPPWDCIIPSLLPRGMSIRYGRKKNFAPTPDYSPSAIFVAREDGKMLAESGQWYPAPTIDDMQSGKFKERLAVASEIRPTSDANAERLAARRCACAPDVLLNENSEWRIPFKPGPGRVFRADQIECPNVQARRVPAATAPDLAVTGGGPAAVELAI